MLYYLCYDVEEGMGWMMLAAAAVEEDVVFSCRVILVA